MKGDSGTTLVLLPGTLCDAALWSGVTLPANVLVHGALRGSALEQAAASALNGTTGQVHLVGFSLGALVAFEVLRRSPQRVARLTLISANSHAPSSAQLAGWKQQEEEVRAGRFDRPVVSLAPAGPHRQKVLEMASRVGPEAFLEQLALLRSRPDSRPLLASYRGPLSVLVGHDDTVTPPGLAREIKALAPQAFVYEIPNAGHYLPLDAPQSVSDHLMEAAHA